MGLDGGFLKFTRLEPRHEPVEERIKHFNEFIAIYSDTESLDHPPAVKRSTAVFDSGTEGCLRQPQATRGQVLRV